MKIKYTLLLIVFIPFLNFSNAQTIKILFDATKAQTAGNADWQVDADQYNLGPNSSGAMLTGYGNEANPQRYPTPAQSGITSTTAETYWKGALSSWGVECAKLGYQVETLPFNGQITYGNTTNTQDLSNYKIFVICEPNILYSLSQKQAIINFVKNGGGLFLISDHTISDRNNDGNDSPVILNDLMTNNGIINNPFGFKFDLANFSQTTTNFNSLPSDPILHGPKGNPTQMQFSNGTSMTLSTSANSTVTGLVYKTGSAHGSTGVMMAHAHYGTGKVIGLGDSSCPDDGTGDTNDALFNGWLTDAAGDHRRIILNATIWLTTNTASPYKMNDDYTAIETNNLSLYPNPAGSDLFLRISNGFQTGMIISIVDMTGREIKKISCQENSETIKMDIDELQTGFYFVNVGNGEKTITKRFIKQN